MHYIRLSFLDFNPGNYNAFILQGLNWRQAVVMLDAKLAWLLFPKLFWLACDFTPRILASGKRGLCVEMILPGSVRSLVGSQAGRKPRKQAGRVGDVATWLHQPPCSHPAGSQLVVL